MNSKARWPALVCSVLLLACILIIYPVAEIGMNDDASYVRTAQILARTGHVVYNGWATAMLGWQLYLGAFFARLFGPSFTAIRASTILIALFTAFLAHRTLISAGLNGRNAIFVALMLVTSPLFLPLAVSFMTDIQGLFIIILCLYACLRALQASSDRAMLRWLIFASLSNALGGTVRQIAWLGVLVMFPCTVWLLRKRRYVLPVGVILYGVSGGIIYGSLRWFQQQPYSIPEPLIPPHLQALNFRMLIERTFQSGLELGLLLMPVLSAFIVAFPWRLRRARILIVAAALLSLAAEVFHFKYLRGLFLVLNSADGNYITQFGIHDPMIIKADPPTLLTTDLRILLTAAALIGIFSCAAFFFLSRSRPSSEAKPSALTSRPYLLILLGPFVIAYLALLIPRGLTTGIFDRYLLPMIFIAGLLLVRFYQDLVRLPVPRTSIAVLTLFALLAVASTHDALSMFRGRSSAIEELRAGGVPDNRIDAGFEHNSIVQIDQTGHVNDPRIRVPAGTYVEGPSEFPLSCTDALASKTPAIRPGYSLSYNPSACGGTSKFPPITVHPWLGPHNVNIYILKTLKNSPL